MGTGAVEQRFEKASGIPDGLHLFALYIDASAAAHMAEAGQFGKIAFDQPGMDFCKKLECFCLTEGRYADAGQIENDWNVCILCGFPLFRRTFHLFSEGIPIDKESAWLLLVISAHSCRSSLKIGEAPTALSPSATLAALTAGVMQ